MPEVMVAWGRGPFYGLQPALGVQVGHVDGILTTGAGEIVVVLN
jgi:hypothetical protein